MRVFAFVLALLGPIGIAAADIYVWTDAGGGRHFTNHREAVPEAQRADARILIAERPRPESVAAPGAEPTSAAMETERLEAAYRAGMAARQRIDAAAEGGGGGGGGTVEIYGPLAVAIAEARESAPIVAPDFDWSPEWSGYFPFVTTGFDRGRSRHQTLRMLLQDQFAIDRDGLFAYDRWNQPGVGPALAPFLPRGLPFPIRQYGRVIYR